jgi:transcriptional regulator with XRE-family HTH domain
LSTGNICLTTGQDAADILAYMQEKFASWLEAEIKSRGWQAADLADAMGKDDATISRVLSGERNAGPEFCRGLAKALRIPQKVVFVRAGLMDEVDPNEPSFTERAWEAMNTPSPLDSRLLEFPC